MFIIICNIFIDNSIPNKNSHLRFLAIALYISLNIAGYLLHVSISHAVCNHHSFISIIGRKSYDIIVTISSCSSLNFTRKAMSLSFCIRVHYIWFVNDFVNLFELRSVITCYFKLKSLFLFQWLFSFVSFFFWILIFLIKLSIGISIWWRLKSNLIFLVTSQLLLLCAHLINNL